MEEALERGESDGSIWFGSNVLRGVSCFADQRSINRRYITVDDSLQKVRFAVLLRTARVAIGWNQQEFADLLGVAKSSITRMETVEMAMPSIFAMRAMQLFRENGLEFDIFSADSTSVIITEKAFQIAKSRLEDQTLRRSDMIPKKNKKISKKSVDAD